ncbi:MAG: DUF2235 domain-containing protein [Akkermansiaceae bacterium]|nr:DUF2235 domain-containing protein [Akkermansiaceae bacterium]MCP5550087.1 DUF2235 domain-containing protein [Akkermansiaceae bacterium]
MSMEPSPAQTRLRRRLVVFLDGTWNNRDDSTNVSNLANLAKEGDFPDRDHPGQFIRQQIYYDEGVGTGPLDRVTGGGFGFGLEVNVRQAYNWLIENYRDSPDPENHSLDDEIFVFGFSRGAYTARSLVGFISRCGLLRPGAPLTVNQLWEGYRMLGVQEEKRDLTWWERIAGREEPPFRKITDLANDAWETETHDVECPGNLTETLLIEWSRRVRITFLGVFDTVGAMGWEALSIPGLRSRLAMHHNMRISSIVQRCRHALAIDENRSSFKHTPIVQYLGNSWTAAEIDAKIDFWEKRVKQRWFCGAHSNIGGGYKNNRLAAAPLRWFHKEAKCAGLELEEVDDAFVGATAKDRTDSHAEFAAPLWAHLLRAKLNYRPIDPHDEVRGPSSRKEHPSDEISETEAIKREIIFNGYSLHRIGESVDPSVRQLADASPAQEKYAPPNLVEYWGRKGGGPDGVKSLHNWLANSIGGRIWLLVWCVLGGLGLGAFGVVFSVNFWPGFAVIVAGLLALIDWAESRTNFERALLPGNKQFRDLSGRFRAFHDTLYWMRAGGVVLAAAGAARFLAAFFRAGWEGGSLADFSANALDLFKAPGLGMLGAAFVATLLGDGLDRFFTDSHTHKLPRGASFVAALKAVPRQLFSKRRDAVSALGSFLVLAVAAWSLALAGFWTARCSGHEAASFDGLANWNSRPSPGYSPGGLILYLAICLGYLAKGFTWVGGPLAKANLFGIRALQKCRTPDALRARFESWRDLLVRTRDSESKRTKKATKRVRALVNESLWRDIVGFILLYGIVFGVAGWIGTKQGVCSWVADFLGAKWLRIPVWIWIPAVGAVADWIEDAFHLRFTANFSNGKPIAGKLSAALAFAAVCVKFAAFCLGVAVCATVFVILAFDVLFLRRPADWRDIVAGTFILGGALALAIGAMLAGVERLKASIEKKKQSIP